MIFSGPSEIFKNYTLAYLGSFAGFIQIFWGFVTGFSGVAVPLTNLMIKDRCS